MTMRDSNYCQIVSKSLTGERQVDEQTFAALTILRERLERLKRVDKIFEKVSFSPMVKNLTRSKNAVAAG